MKTSLEHLPDRKRQELARVLEVLFAEFEEATKRKSSPRGQGRILKVILFGSYARTDWVDDPIGGYKSDYDLLVVVNHDDFTDMTDYWSEAEARLEQAFDIAHTLSAPAQFIVHSLEDVNRQLSLGRPFFTEIQKEGIALYEAGDHPLARPAMLSLEEAHSEAQGHYDKWFESAGRFLVNGIVKMRWRLGACRVTTAPRGAARGAAPRGLACPSDRSPHRWLRKLSWTSRVPHLRRRSSLLVRTCLRDRRRVVRQRAKSR